MLISLRELYLNDTFLEYLPGSFGRLAHNDYLVRFSVFKLLFKVKQIKNIRSERKSFKNFTEILVKID